MSNTIKLVIASPFALAFCIGCSDATNLDTNATDFEATVLELVSDDDAPDDLAGDARGVIDSDLDGEAGERAEHARHRPHPSLNMVCHFLSRRDQIRDRFDTDGDGQLSREERAAIRDEIEGRVGDRPQRIHPNGHPMRHFAAKRVKFAFDVDNDGTLSEDERAELVAALESRCEVRREAILTAFDANNDGQLDDAEKAAAQAARQARRDERRAAFLAEYDTDGDGEISREEKAAIRDDLKDRRDAIRARLLEQFDADEDGELSETELAALKAALRERIANGANSGQA